MVIMYDDRYDSSPSCPLHQYPFSVTVVLRKYFVEVF